MLLNTGLPTAKSFQQTQAILLFLKAILSLWPTLHRAREFMWKHTPPPMELFQGVAFFKLVTLLLLKQCPTIITDLVNGQSMAIRFHQTLSIPLRWILTLT